MGRFRNLLTGTNVLGGIKRETLSETLDAAMKELKEAKALGPESESECPVGKLNVQMLSVTAIVDPMALAQLLTGTVLDLVCEKGEHVKTWNGVKKRFRNLLTGTNVLGGIKRETLSETLDAAMKELKEAKALGPESESECPVGKLNLQLLSVTAIVDPMALAQ